MNLDEYQTAALRTINPSLNDRDRLLDASAGLAEEAAELLGLIRKRVFQGREIDEGRLDKVKIVGNSGRAVELAQR